ncbi:hypothetical protein Pyrfu_1266 [Pyrolobus fumarii 1A]|uniref:Antitoxin n=1 Tax=Pyrolobus fumarii (strain DSM 11204 / 1A) TaxID=694429 RepID=G0EGA0_PYRF1|nr:hypothetical protein Pyrfu_1266 [Pyrolobus fumarii 1A]
MSVRVPAWVKRVLEEKRVEYQSVVREVLTGLAEAASGEALQRLREAFRIAERAWGDSRLSTDEVVEAVRCARND